MFGSFQIARVYGIPIRIHWTLLLFLPYVALRLAGALGVGTPLWGWIAAVALFTSVALHELGHAVIAIGRGYPVRDIVLTPIGGVAFLARAPGRARDEFMIAIAGPIVSLLLALACWFGSGPLLAAGLPEPGATLGLIGTINMALFVFNLIPCFPMDGGRVFRAWQTTRVGRLEATRRAVRLGKFFAWTFGIFGVLYGHWMLVIIAFVVHQAAAAEYAQVRMQEAVRRNPFAGFGPFAPPSGGPPPIDERDIEIGPPPYGR